MSRENAIARAGRYIDDGSLFDGLSRRVAIPSESQNESRVEEMRAYLTEAMRQALEKIGYQCRMLDNSVSARLPMLFAERIEGTRLPTVLTYGHGDVFRGLDEDWDKGRSPWRLEITGVLKKKNNKLQIEIANRWSNRRLGDTQPPDENARTLKWESGLLGGKEYKTGRYTFSTGRDLGVLLPSGLIGPVRISIMNY